MNRGALMAYFFFWGCLLAGLPKEAFAQSDSLTPRVILPFDSLVMDVYTSFPFPAATALSYKGDSLPVDTLGSVDTAHIGLYIIRYIAVDSSVQRSDTAILHVFVVDRIPPRVSLFGNLYITLRQGRIFREPGVAVTDNYDFDPIIFTRGTFKDTKSTGLYYITYQAQDSSGNLSDTVLRFIEVVDSVTVGIDEGEPDIRFSVYPNPASSHVFIKTEPSIPVEARLVSPHGVIIGVVRFQRELLLPVADLPPGIYFLQMRYGEARRSVPVLIAR